MKQYSISLFLILISSLFVIFNADAPDKISNIGVLLVLFYHFVTLSIGYLIINKTMTRKFKLSRIVFLNYFLLGYTISLCLDYFYWIPELIKDYSSDTWGAFDPIKYYAIAFEMTKGISMPDALNFPVVYIYYIEFLLFGTHPLIPFFINSLGYLYAVISVAKFLNNNSIGLQTAKYAWLFLIPEVLYFNLTASKDIICLICATIIFCHSQRIIARNYNTGNIIVVLVAFVVMFVARTSMALAAAISILIFYVDFRKINLKTISFLAVGLVVFVFSTRFTNSLGVAKSTTVDGISDLATKQLSGDMSSSIELRDGSAGVAALALVPHNSFEFVVFGVARSFVTANTSPKEIMNMLDFSNINMTVRITGLLMSLSWLVLFFAMTKRKYYSHKEIRMLLIVVLLYFLIVGLSTPLMVHKRYRIIYDLLFFALTIKSILFLKINHSKNVLH